MIASEWSGLEQTFEGHPVQLHNFSVHSQGIFSHSFLQMLQKHPLGGFCKLAQPTPCKTLYSYGIKLPQVFVSEHMIFRYYCDMFENNSTEATRIMHLFVNLEFTLTACIC